MRSRLADALWLAADDAVDGRPGMDDSLLPGGRSVSGSPTAAGRGSGAGRAGLADDVYWLVHHDVTGRLRTARLSAGVMLAAGVLAGLAAAGQVCIVEGRMVAHVPVTAADALHAGVLAQIIAEDQRYTVRQWLECLSEDIGERVAERMVAAGRAGWSRTGVWHRSQVVANPGDDGPAWVHAGLRDAIVRGDVLDQRQLFLLGLAQHSSMTEHPLAGVDAGYVRYAVSQLSMMPDSWQRLIAVAAELIRHAAITR